MNLLLPSAPEYLEVFAAQQRKLDPSHPMRKGPSGILADPLTLIRFCGKPRLLGRP